MSQGRAKSTAASVGRKAPRKYCPFANTYISGVGVYVVTCVMVVDGRVIVVVDNSGVPEASVTVSPAASQKLGSGAAVIVDAAVVGAAVVGCGMRSAPSWVKVTVPIGSQYCGGGAQTSPDGQASGA